MSLILFLGVAIFLTCMMAGCGKKGPPVPPRQTKPPRITDLSATIAGDKVQLSWTVERPLPHGLDGFLVYRSKTALSEPICETCPIVFQRIADIPIKDKNTGKFKGGKMTYVEDLEKGYRYIYKVNAYMENKETGKDSNYADFTY
jgi:predicted small lipoprotein YifL